ncbi:MAG: hypothetical protein WAV54_07300 [Acidimicrobiales bacterium]
MSQGPIAGLTVVRPLIAALHVKYAALELVAAARNCWDAFAGETVVGGTVELTVVDVEVGLTVVDVGLDVDGVAAGLELEQPAAKIISPITTMHLAFIDPPRSCL